MMRNLLIGLVLSVFLNSCTPKVNIEGIDKGELRRTEKEDIAQLSLNLIMHFSTSEVEIGYSEIDIIVNHVDLGKSVIAGDTEPILSAKYALPLRVTYPFEQLVLTDSNLLEINGFIHINGKSVKVSYSNPSFVVKNYTNL
ncbi:MAG: hypothetical protein M9958_01755 [Chitinophagales bacterium]|nr:hypothetical protein [Chitinophagales bacterium]